MLGKYYLVKITGKDTKRFLRNLYKMHIPLEKVEQFKDYCYIKVNEESLERILEIKTIYEMEIIDRFSLAKVEYLAKKNYIFIITIIISLMLLFTLSKMIFKVEVVHSSSQIRDMLQDELAEYGIRKFRFQLSFDKQEKIVEEILEKHKKDIEWLEIERIGTKYVVKVEERKIKEIKTDHTPQNIVAKKDGIIKSIDAITGEVVKKKNDYVKKGDILITGVIKNKEEVKTKVHAEGKVFAETWYKVNVEMPLKYHDSKLTGNEKNILSFYFLGKEIALFGAYEDAEEEEMIGFRNLALPIGVSYKKTRERIVTDLKLTKKQATKLALKKAKEKLEKKLGPEDEIILEKTLKIEENHSKITVEVFYKVKEDITATGEILEEQLPNDENTEQQ